MRRTRSQTAAAVGLVGTSCLAVALRPAHAEAPAVDVVTRAVEVRLEPSATAFVTGSRLRSTLNTAAPGVAWRNVPIRTLLRQVGDTYALATVYDRRLDPTATPEVQRVNAPLETILSEAATDVGAELRIVGNVAYFGPPEVADVVRTLVELRRRELEGIADRRLARRRLALLRGETIHWGDLAESTETVQRVADRFGLTVENPNLVPHDLWSGAVLPELSAADALTLMLLQFDLTFAWGPELTTIELVPLPADRSTIVVEHRYSPRGSPGEVTGDWRERFGVADMDIDGRNIIVRGTIEQHEAIERDLDSPPRKRASLSPRDPVPLEKRRFTLTVSRVPASAVMAKLEESGITFDYRQNEFQAAGIDLATLISIDVRQADAREFFEALFGPLGLTAEAEGTTVRLRPMN